ncbi:MAG: Glu/Leu/Phe/Val dehydrogenase [Proteobacteria bacterium]|nr:Glu/Leu/Phe/Val dehydrogenase [Desulfobulbaceae bacterium]MBU4154534.1 Glu/Leu/Phe/Val dehydrogenase [Pseudomonadota bacterium]MDP2106636.1 Glu/Leu/Phe/Val dehydrogenase dimerization domain-containing protein [Desulfobulbaceae bacterium]
MTSNIAHHTITVVEYSDPIEHFKGWLVIDGGEHSLCAGGMRVQQNLTCEHVMAMAKNMTMKMRICGLPIDGAKCGIDYHPDAPGKLQAMTRFMAAIKPYIEDRYSMGPDLNTSMDELESIARELNIPSVKMAIAKAQGITLRAFLDRYEILSHKAIGDWPLGRLRAGFGVAMAALAALDFMSIPPQGARIAIQGFGNLAKAAIVALTDAGAIITAIGDAKKCVLGHNHQPLPVHLYLDEQGTLLPEITSNDSVKIEPKETITTCECDLLILAAIEGVITRTNADQIKAKVVIPGANLAITPDGEEALFARRIIALPSFVAGCGGSLSMNGLFGPAEKPQTRQVLDYIASAMTQMVDKILNKSHSNAINPTKAAEMLCRDTLAPPRLKPYSLG